MAKSDNRLFAPFPIEMDEHPKIAPLTDSAFRAVFEATFYSRRMLSDGFLDERIVLKRWGQTVADELSSNDPKRPSWVRVEGGWQIHDFDKHHPLRADIEESRQRLSERNSEKGKRSGELRRARAEQEANQNEPDVNRERTESNTETETETETETSSSTKKRETAKRGSHLSPEWLPSPASIEKARADAPSVDHKSEHAVFIDYWISMPGQRGVKLDWDATWRNWMRRKQSDMAGKTKTTPTDRAMDVIESARRIQETEDRKAIN